MSTEQKSTSPGAAAHKDEQSEMDATLGEALLLLHRLLPRLDDSGQGDQVQAGLRQILASVEAARAAHQRLLESRKPIVVGGHARVEAEIVAVIAAAVAAVVGQPYRLVAVHPMPQLAPHLNVWALEGRTQIFQSHRIR